MEEAVGLLQEIEELGNTLREKEQELARIRRRGPHEAVQDFVLRGPGDVEVPLSSLFGDKRDLLLIHNMGSRCPYCTLWADGFNGVVGHLEDRAAFVVVSPDAPDAQAEFAASRNWTFRMASDGDSGFTEKMGFSEENEGQTYYMPGCSTYRKQDDGTIVRIAQASFGPGDVYCAPWRLFALLADGAGDWSPKFSYGD